MVLRDDPPPGREAQVDYGYLGLWTDPQTEKRRKVWILAMVLSHSRHMFVRVVNPGDFTRVNKMGQQAWLQSHVEAFAFFGGTPAILLSDATRSLSVLGKVRV